LEKKNGTKQGLTAEFQPTRTVPRISHPQGSAGQHLMQFKFKHHLMLLNFKQQQPGHCTTNQMFFTTRKLRYYIIQLHKSNAIQYTTIINSTMAQHSFDSIEHHLQQLGWNNMPSPKITVPRQHRLSRLHCPHQHHPPAHTRYKFLAPDKKSRQATD